MKNIFAKKWVFLSMVMLIFLLQSNSILGNSNLVQASSNSNLLITSEEGFIDVVRENQNYKDYKDLLVSETPYLLKETTDQDNKPMGYMAQYEVKYNYDKQGDVKLTSLLTFVYDRNNQQIQVGVVDYSKVMDTDKVYIVDLNTNDKEETYLGSLSKNKAIQEMKRDLEEKSNDIKQTSASTNDSIYCWHCTKTETYGGSLDGDCSFLLGSACSLVPNKFVSLICMGGVYVSCYVPKYTICVDGYWTSVCPLPD
jgi:hypothetical protein